MSELQRLTTEYVDREDRIRLSGESVSNGTEVLWLTRRLIGRLVPHLCAWLEQRGAMGVTREDVRVTEAVQGFALQAAMRSLVPQPPVRAEAAQRNWLVQAVDVSVRKAALHLTFRGQANESLGLNLPLQALRQWLGILHAQSCVGQWHLDVWPSWLVEQVAEVRGGAETLH